LALGAATLRRRLERILAALQTAGLKVRSVTSSSLALFDSTNPASAAPNYMIYLRSNYAEIVEQNGADVRTVKYLPFTHTDHRAAESGPSGLFQQLNNYFALTAPSSGSGEKGNLILWDGMEPQTISLESWKQHLQRPFSVRNGFEERHMDSWDWSGISDSGKFVAPASLAVVGLQTAPAPIDFLHSKVTVKMKASHKKPVLYAAAAILVLIAAGVTMAWSWHQDKRTIAEKTAQLEARKAEIEVAEDLAQKISTVNQWYAGRPKVLDCLLELTMAFPEQGTIWVSSLALREDIVLQSDGG
jgi:hypothetical protein